MTTTLRALTLGAAAVGLALAVSPAAEAKKSCAMISGQGTGITHPVATDQALWSLQEAITKFGGKAAGKVATTCKYELVVSSCTSKQRACK